MQGVERTEFLPNSVEKCRVCRKKPTRQRGTSKKWGGTFVRARVNHYSGKANQEGNRERELQSTKHNYKMGEQLIGGKKKGEEARNMMLLYREGEG